MRNLALCCTALPASFLCTAFHCLSCMPLPALCPWPDFDLISCVATFDCKAEQARQAASSTNFQGTDKSGSVLGRSQFWQPPTSTLDSPCPPAACIRIQLAAGRYSTAATMTLPGGSGGAAGATCCRCTTVRSRSSSAARRRRRASWACRAAAQSASWRHCRGRGVGNAVAKARLALCSLQVWPAAHSSLSQLTADSASSALAVVAAIQATARPGCPSPACASTSWL